MQVNMLFVYTVVFVKATFSDANNSIIEAFYFILFAHLKENNHILNLEQMTVFTKTIN